MSICHPKLQVVSAFGQELRAQRDERATPKLQMVSAFDKSIPIRACQLSLPKLMVVSTLALRTYAGLVVEGAAR